MSFSVKFLNKRAIFALEVVTVRSSFTLETENSENRRHNEKTTMDKGKFKTTFY